MKDIVTIGFLGLIGAAVLYIIFFFALPWGSLQSAHYHRQIQVVNAQANLEAQKYNAESEVVRAGGVAQANNIIKNSITDQYIKYLWVQTLDKGVDHQIIYVPTELGLPITEAGRAK